MKYERPDSSVSGPALVEAVIRHKSRSRPTFICSRRTPSPLSPLVTDQSITRIST